MILLTNVFQHLYYAEIHLNENMEFILSYLARSFQINAKSNLKAKRFLSIFP